MCNYIHEQKKSLSLMCPLPLPKFHLTVNIMWHALCGLNQNLLRRERVPYDLQLGIM